MIKTIALAVVVLVAALLAFAATRPPDFAVSRSLAMKAPPDRIYPLIANFRRWATWSPYETRDPAMTRRYEGTASGKGAAYAWSGNSQAGAGRMEIVDTDPPRQVDIQLDFTKPIEGHNLARFTLAPQGDATLVTWSMKGSSPFIARVMGIFMDMDKLIGGDFEAGLAKLKATVER